MLDAICSPRDNVGRSGGHSEVTALINLLIFIAWSLAHFICLCLDVLLKYLHLCDLRIAVIHHFIKKLVSDDEIVSQTFVFELLEIALENIPDLVEESEDHSDIRVSLGHRDHVNVVNFDPNVGYVFVSKNGLDKSFFQL